MLDLVVHQAVGGWAALSERVRTGVANLVDNAVRYNAADGDIWVSTRTVAGKRHLTVANTGPFLSPADATAFFQRLNARGVGHAPVRRERLLAGRADHP